MKEKISTVLNQFLVLNVFFVLFSFIWFVIALIGHSLEIPLGLELWRKLWEPVFTPAIGILMLGAIVSGLVNYLSNKLSKKA